MTRRCTICNHPDRKDIDAVLVAHSKPFRYIAAHFNVSTGSLQRHKANHLLPLVADARDAAAVEVVKRYEVSELEHAIDVVKQLKAINAACFTVLKEARDSKESRLVLQAVDRVQRQIELQAKLIGQLPDQQTTVNVLVANPEWLRLRNGLLGVLAAYPQARRAVLEMLRDGSAGG